MTGRLYYGDCLTIMREMGSASVDLIYLDPPFNSNRDYNAIYEDETGRPLPAQVEAFCDTWTLDEERERVIRHMPILIREAGIDDEIAQFWRFWADALRRTNPRLLAYLSYMVQRLLPMRTLLRPAGSIYLHCDPAASHYIKIMMDAIFGHENFRNEIIWQRTFAKGLASTRLATNHDVLLCYGRTSATQWNALVTPYDPENLDEKTASKYKHRDPDGRLFQLDNLTNPNKNRPNLTYEFLGVTRVWRWSRERMQATYEAGLVIQPSPGAVPRFKRYLDEQIGRPVGDVWVDIPPINSQARERLGYATQKPLALLERIIEASTNPGDVVFDPFCGCATTLEAAHRLGREWIGVDIAIHAIKRVAKVRLEERLQLAEGRDFIIEGVPRDLEGARDLWQRDKYHFQKWAVEQVDGFVTTKRSADGGIDGRLYFAMPQESPHARDPLRSMVLEVKGGVSVGIAVVRDLRGVLEREEAEMAGLIVMEPLGATKERNFRREMAQAGDLDLHGTKYARMQVLTVEEILDGKRFLTPSVVGRSAGQETMALPEPT